MAVPNIFGSATSAIPLSQLDTNFATPVTIGNTAVQLGNTVTSFGNVTLTNVTISSGNVTVSAGSNTAPSITTVGDTNTGIFFPAADTIAFSEGGTESARFDSGGRLLVGNSTSYAGKFQSWGAVTANAATPNLVAIDTTSMASGVGGELAFIGQYTAGDYAYFGSIRGIKENGTDNNTACALTFFTRPNGTAPTEAARINSSGNLLVGTTSNASGTPKVAVNGSIQPLWGQNRVAIVFDNDFRQGLYFDSTTRNMTVFSTTSDSGGNILFSTRNGAGAGDADYGTERMRIDSSGNLLVGTTSSIGNGGVIQAKTTFAALYAETNSSSGSQNVFDIANVSNTAYVPVRFWVNGYGVTQVGSISCTTTATSYNTSSDYRLKNTIAPMTGALAKVALLKPCTYKWNADGSAGEGFIAHELAEVAPYAVTGEKDGEQMQGVDYGKITPLLTAALQEAIAEIQSLKARVAELEAK
jgi:hypothetical protein